MSAHVGSTPSSHGSQALFAKIWREHDEIREFGAKGHAKCDRCGEILVEKAKYEGRGDQIAREANARLDSDQDHHDGEHRGERDYAEN